MNVFASLLIQIRMATLISQSVYEDNVYASNNIVELLPMTNRTAIVTGGSSGIGLEVVKMFLESDMDVVMACRNTTKGENVVQEIREKSSIKSGKVRVMEMDNASFDSIKKFVTAFQNNYEKLDVLVNNAGVASFTYQETKDGFEEDYGVNYLSHFLLTLLLKQQLQNAGTPEHHARVVSITSMTYVLTGINFEDINHKQDFEQIISYAQSKLALMMFTKKLARILSEANLPISAYAVHTGVVDTGIWNESYFNTFKPVTSKLFRTKRKGAQSVVFASISPKVEGKSGLYISHCLEWLTEGSADNETVQDELFELSLKQVGLKHFEL